MKKINYIILLMLTIVVASCEPTFEKQYNWAYPVTGEWTVKAYIDGEAIVSKPFEIKSYNSSFGKDSIWIDDIVTYAPGYGFWDFQAKAAVNMTTMTFGNGNDTIASVVPDYEIGIKIMNGKIVNKDSIYFEIQFQDDTNPYETTYQIAGHRTTSYEEYMQQ